jgi:hypothetical protein
MLYRGAKIRKKAEIAKRYGNYFQSKAVSARKYAFKWESAGFKPGVYRV